MQMPILVRSNREDVSEIAGRYDEGGGFPRPFPKPQPSVKIIDGLGEYAG